MHAYDNATRAGRDAKSDSPSEELRIAVTFKRADGGPGLTKFTPALSASTVNRFVPDPLDVDRAIHQLSRAGFTLTQRGKLTASVRGTRKQYEEVFGTKLSVWEMSKTQDYAFRSFYFPKQ